MKEAFTNLEKEAMKMHLQINQGKTKYVTVTKKICTHSPPYLEIGSCRFETAYSFNTWDQRSTIKMISMSTYKNVSYQQTDVSVGLENI
jgi:hypothetical protein